MTYAVSCFQIEYSFLVTNASNVPKDITRVTYAVKVLNRGVILNCTKQHTEWNCALTASLVASGLKHSKKCRSIGWFMTTIEKGFSTARAMQQMFPIQARSDAA